MSARSWLGYIAAFVLGMLAMLPYFLFGGTVSSRLFIWCKLIIYAILLFSPLRLFGRPQFRLVPIFCLPVIALSSAIGLPGPHDLSAGLQIIAEPILCVWIGALFAWIALSFRSANAVIPTPPRTNS